MQQLTRIVVTKSAYNDLVKLDNTTRRRLKDRITLYMIKRNPLEYAVKLKDSRLGTYRWWIGDYRIIFDIDKNKVVILRVQHRSDVYKQ